MQLLIGKTSQKEAITSMANGDYHIKMQAIQELKEAVTIKKANEELLDYFTSSLRWLIHYSEKNNIPLPEKDKIIKAVERAMEIANKTAPTNLQQPDATTEQDNGTQK